MYKSILAAAIILALSLSVFTQAATYGGGRGTAEDPYQIRTPRQMNAIGANPDDWGKSFRLMADIDMSDYTGTQYNIIGNLTAKFTGTFDGNGYIISNLIYETTLAKDYIGLFGCIENAVIQNIGLENISFVSGGDFVGGLAGYSKQSILINCYAAGQITANALVGGLAGFNQDGKLIACYTVISIEGIDYVGGLAGYCVGNLSEIYNCYASGSLIAENTIGGLLGSNDRGKLTASYAAAKIAGTFHVGGLVGENITPVHIMKDEYPYEDEDSSEYLFTACFWDTRVSRTNTGVGNLMHNPQGMIGATTDSMTTRSTFIAAGWDFEGETANGLCDYWQMKAGDYPYLVIPVWTLRGSGTSESPYIISSMIDLGKTALRPFACYHLENDLDLSDVSWMSAVIPVFGGTLDGRGHVISGLVIDQSNNDVGLIGTLYDGEVSNLILEDIYVTGYDAVGGLVGYNLGSVTNCMVSGSVTGVMNVGGLSGYNSGTLSQCSSSILIKADSSAGGLAGYNESILTNCYATGRVNGVDHIGGLVGMNRGGELVSCYGTSLVNATGYDVGGLVGMNMGGAITAAYASGSVSGRDYVGGFIGYNSQGTLTDCYAAGQVDGTGRIGGFIGWDDRSIISACFWDTQASRITVGVGNVSPDPEEVMGKTTAEMKIRSTFIDVGWDFTHETENGTRDYWYMPANDYPRLAWKLKLPAKAANPKPVHRTTNARTNTILKWSSGSGAASHDVYFGTDPDLDPNTSFYGSQAETFFDPGRLEVLTTYYWRIDETNAKGTTIGTTWNFMVASSSFTVGKCTITALKTPGSGTVDLFGFFDAYEENFLAADEVTVILNAEDLKDPDNCIWTFPVNTVTYKQEKFLCTTKGVSQCTLKMDTKTSKMQFSAKNVNLTGLACPITMTIMVGGYSEKLELNEAIVNGSQKSCPIQFMRGVKNTLTVDKYGVTHRRKLNADSFTARGTFTLAEDYNKNNPLVITLGTQTFTVAGSQFQAGKTGIESCKKAISSEGPIVDAKFDFIKCTYNISVKNATIGQSGTVDFGINCFGVALDGLATVNIK